MAAKTMMLNLYGELGNFVEKLLQERHAAWETECDSYARSKNTGVKGTVVGTAKKTARVESERVVNENKVALKTLRSNRPTRVAIVHELLEKGVEAVKTESLKNKKKT